MSNYVIYLSHIREIYHMEGNMRKELSVINQIRHIYLYCGIAWCMVAFFNLFDGILANIVSVAVFAGIICLMLKTMTSKKENLDEMAEEHIIRAKADTFDIMQFVWMCATIVSMIVGSYIEKIPESMNIWQIGRCLIFLLLGVQNILTAKNFLKYEKDEDECIF